MNLPLDHIWDGIRLHLVDLWMKWSYVLVVLGTLSGVVSSLTTAETGIVALTVFTHRAGHDVLDLSRSLVDILLPVGFVLHLSLLPSTSLLHGLHILLRLEFALVVIMSLCSLSAMRALFTRVRKSGKSNMLRVHLRC